MRAVVANRSVPRYLLTAAAQRLPGGLGTSAGWGRGGMLSLAEEQPNPVLPAAPGWVRLRPELSGVCGSDVGLAHAKMSMVLSVYYLADLLIPGHETVAVVEETGPGVGSVMVGDRVAVNPVLSCVERGFDPICRACADGFAGVCERFDQPGSSGCEAVGLGFDARLGGGWAEQLVAHERQLFPVGAIPSARAVLAEPASIALHAVLQWDRRSLAGGDRVVVIGPGSIGLLATASLRVLHPDLDVIVLSPDDFGSTRAMAAGASRVLTSGPGAVERLAASDGGRVLRPTMTRTPILEQGVDAVFDCVGSEATIDLSLHLLRSSGQLVLVGAAGKQSVDWSLVWNRRLTVSGTHNSGPEAKLGGRYTMAQVVEWLGDDAYPVDGLLTHTFALGDFAEALATASAGPRAGSVKTALRPNPDLPLVQRQRVAAPDAVLRPDAVRDGRAGGARAP